MEVANCIVDDPEDTRFIRKPSDDEEGEWRQICIRCPVFDDCLAWVERLEETPDRLTDVFAAGEWRA